jgi:hypothetical protein
MALKRARSLKELRHEFDSISSTVAGDTRFGAQAILFIAERLENIEALLGKGATKKKRQPSEWQRFFAAGMRAGKTAAQIGEEWLGRESARSPRFVEQLLRKVGLEKEEPSDG